VKKWLREWLEIQGDVHTANQNFAKTEKVCMGLSSDIHQLEANIAELNTEVDRLRSLIVAKPKEKVLKPRTWAATQEALNKGR
jgi:outer membrane murein-binding lipoprotein Lpp